MTARRDGQYKMGLDGIYRKTVPLNVHLIESNAGHNGVTSWRDRNQQHQQDTKMQNALTDAKPLFQPRASALAVMAGRFNVEPDKLLGTLKNTVFKGASNDELLALVVVANEYGLNPLTKEIYAFPAKGGGIVPVVSVDGWNNVANSHPQMDGMEFEFEHDENGKLISCTCIIWRKDRNRPIKVTEYLSECRRSTDPWKMEHRMLRHKALIQCARVAFGFSGVYDEDDARQIGGMVDVTPVPAAVVDKVEPKQEPAPQAPIEADFKLNETPVSLLDQLADRIAASGLEWPAIAFEAEQGGLFLDPLIPINEQPEDVLRDILGAFDAIVSNMKGASK